MKTILTLAAADLARAANSYRDNKGVRVWIAREIRACRQDLDGCDVGWKRMFSVKYNLYRRLGR